MDILFITHANVVISSDIPVPDWPLSARGRARHRAHAETLAPDPPKALWVSTERKAQDAAGIYAERLKLSALADAELGENDRSATGYLSEAAFQSAVDAFFDAPEVSYRGWETAQDAQRRIARTVERIARKTPVGPLLVVAHGGVGALLLAHVTGADISRDLDQPGTGGGNAFRFTWPDRRLIHGWRDIAPGLQ